MKRFPIGRTVGAACVLVATLSSGRASAQDAQQAQGPMTVEPLQAGWTFAPDVKVTHFDGASRTLGGAYVGWVIDNTLMIGGAGYWLTDSNHTRQLSYGGALIEWRQGADQPIGFSVKGLFGAGTATVPQTVTLFGIDPNHGGGMPPSPTNLGTATIGFREDFFVAEPQLDLLLRLAPHVHLHVGGGYRAVSNAQGLEPEIRGATGSVSLEFGPWSHR